MRSFLISLCILIGILTLILADSAAILRTTDELMTLCSQTSHGSPPDSADLLLAKWENCRDFLSLTVHHSEIDAAEEALIAALSAFDPLTRDANLNLFAAILRRIADSQRFDMFNIL